MFGRRSSIQLLEAVLKDFQQLASGEPDRVRNLIPASEVWRFFIEKRRQQHGRSLKLASSFNDKDNLNLSVKEYVEKVEKLSFKKKNFNKSKLMKELRKHKWFLSEEDCSKFTLNDLLRLDRGWIPFEMNEPGYLHGMMTAFQEIFSSTVVLDVDFLRKLHALALSGVTGTVYDDPSEEADARAGEFREKDEVEFHVTRNSASQEGIREFLDRKHAYLFLELKFYSAGKLLGSFFITEDAMDELHLFLQGQPNNLEKYCQPKDMDALLAAFKDNPDIESLLMRLAKSKNNTEIAYWLYGVIDNPMKDVKVFFLSSRYQLEGSLSEFLQQRLKQHLDSYQEKITHAETPLEKVELIVECVQACELDHPFYDLNGRVFCMLLVNYLLYREKLPLAILDDSNHLNLFSKEEMVKELIQGMANTMKLIKEGSLFKVETGDVVRELKSKPLFAPMLEYFWEAEKIEIQGRHEMVKLKI